MMMNKEGLVVTCTFGKFTNCVLGMQLSVKSVQWPLVPLLGSTDLKWIPLRILRFCACLMKLNPRVVCVPIRGNSESLSVKPVHECLCGGQESLQL